VAEAGRKEAWGGGENWLLQGYVQSGERSGSSGEVGSGERLRRWGRWSDEGAGGTVGAGCGAAGLKRWI
jgi:hypothetical protein